VPSYNLADAGSIAVQPLGGAPSGDVFASIPLNDQVVLDGVQLDMVTLSDGSPKSVAFGDLTGANYVFIYAQGAKVKAQITSADGSTQAVPVDPKLNIISLSVPITAIALTRDPSSSTVTQVRVLLGHKA